jgi:hypothetical protein
MPLSRNAKVSRCACRSGPSRCRSTANRAASLPARHMQRLDSMASLSIASQGRVSTNDSTFKPPLHGGYQDSRNLRQICGKCMQRIQIPLCMSKSLSCVSIQNSMLRQFPGACSMTRVRSRYAPSGHSEPQRPLLLLPASLPHSCRFRSIVLRSDSTNRRSNARALAMTTCKLRCLNADDFGASVAQRSRVSQRDANRRSAPLSAAIEVTKPRD